MKTLMEYSQQKRYGLVFTLGGFTESDNGKIYYNDDLYTKSYYLYADNDENAIKEANYLSDVLIRTQKDFVEHKYKYMTITSREWTLTNSSHKRIIAKGD